MLHVLSVKDLDLHRPKLTAFASVGWFSFILHVH